MKIRFFILVLISIASVYTPCIFGAAIREETACISQNLMEARSGSPLKRLTVGLKDTLILGNINYYTNKLERLQQEKRKLLEEGISSTTLKRLDAKILKARAQLKQQNKNLDCSLKEKNTAKLKPDKRNHKKKSSKVRNYRSGKDFRSEFSPTVQKWFPRSLREINSNPARLNEEIERRRDLLN